MRSDLICVYARAIEPNVMQTEGDALEPTGGGSNVAGISSPGLPHSHRNPLARESRCRNAPITQRRNRLSNIAARCHCPLHLNDQLTVQTSPGAIPGSRFSISTYALRSHRHVGPCDKARTVAVKVFHLATPNQDRHQLIKQTVVGVDELELRHVSTIFYDASLDTKPLLHKG